MTERKGLKICYDTAENIREIVAESLTVQTRVPKPLVGVLRDVAKVDADTHNSLDRNFRTGGGSATGR